MTSFLLYCLACYLLWGVGIIHIAATEYNPVFDGSRAFWQLVIMFLAAPVVLPLYLGYVIMVFSLFFYYKWLRG